jgi:6-phosphogluconolactonase (cycloisomerase 2 family)
MRVRHFTLAALAALALVGYDDARANDRITRVDDGAPTNVLYVGSNNHMPGRNSVLAYRRGADGSLSFLGEYMTGGTGVANPTRGKLGPNDLDDPIVVNPEHTRMFVVNAGSNTIAVMDINSDGSLTPVAGSPFPSNGRNPVALGLAGNRLYVVNKNEDPAQLPNDGLPNYTGFTVESNGRLTPIPGSTVSTIAMASPSQALVSRNGRLVFGADFLAPFVRPGIGSLRAFQVADNGTLAQPPGSPYRLPKAPPSVPAPARNLRLPLGLYLHPTQNILYVGHVTYNQLGVYNFDPNTGAISFVTQVPNSGKEICWVRVTRNGSRIYTVNNIDNSVSFYDNSNPRAPVERQKLTMKEPGPMFLNDRGKLSFMQITSTPFQPALSPDERFIYVVNQRVDYNSSYTRGNNLHILRVAEDGTLSEPGSPLELPVPTQSRPHGVVVF